MDDLMALLRSKAHPLAFNGTLVSGRVLSQLATAYVDALNQGAVPQLVTAWQVGRPRGIRAAPGVRRPFDAVAGFNTHCV